MMSNDNFNLTEMVPDFPNKPVKEISRDSFLRWITSEFNPSCQKILIASGPLTGKTNTFAQFASYHQNRVISYFINSNPLTQDLKNYLYILCNQIKRLLDQPSLPEDINLEALKSSFTGLVFKLTEQAKIYKKMYYFVVDGLEWGLSGEKGHRIVDFPLISFSGSPYVLYSCRLDRIENIPIPTDVCVKDDISHFLEFNLNDTKDFLAGYNLGDDEIKIIHQKAKGLPGYVKVIKDTLAASGNEWLKQQNLPDNLENLIEKQLTLVYSNATPQTVEAIEYITISPKPLSIEKISALVGSDTKHLLTSLQNS